MRRTLVGVVLVAGLTCVAALPAYAARWKVGSGPPGAQTRAAYPSGMCYYDTTESGTNQCRYKIDGGTCRWMQDSGSDQCSPNNTPPQVSLTSPANNATFTAGANISLTATASDPGGSVTKVEFFSNGTLRGTDTTSPYAFTWSNVAAGSYSLTARATDNGGATTTSTAVNIVVSGASNSPPSALLTSPANGATFTMPITVTLTASASDANGSVVRVEFFAGQSLIGSDTTAPYSVSWSPSAAGTYVLTARATDNAGATTWSGGVSVTVNPQTFTILINGCCVDPSGSWIHPSSAMSLSIGSTYGQTPMPWAWTSNSLLATTPPSYSGILTGGQDLANFLTSLPPGQVNLISHSHGGNVVLTSQIWSSRQIRRYVQLATPINWDFGDWRLALGYTVSGRCQASSWSDWQQFFGASPYQVGNFAYAAYNSIAGAQNAFEALLAGDYESSYAWFASSVFNALQADAWFESTKVEVEGPTYMFSGRSHGEVHEPYVWDNLPASCK